MSVVERQLAEKYDSIAPLLDERQRRRWLGIEARALGRGGVSAVARATGASRTTVTAAVGEVAGGGRIRRQGGYAERERVVHAANGTTPSNPNNVHVIYAQVLSGLARKFVGGHATRG